MTPLTVERPREQATQQDWIDLIGLYRVIVRARTGWRFTSLEWAK